MPEWETEITVDAFLCSCQDIAGDDSRILGFDIVVQKFRQGDSGGCFYEAWIHDIFSRDSNNAGIVDKTFRKQVSDSDYRFSVDSPNSFAFVDGSDGGDLRAYISCRMRPSTNRAASVASATRSSTWQSSPMRWAVSTKVRRSDTWIRMDF